MRYANRFFPVLYYIVICCLSGLPYFSTLSHNGRIFGGKNYWTKRLCVDFLLQFLSESFLILQRTMHDIFMNLNSLHVKCQLFLSHFPGTRIFSTDFRKFLKHRISWKAVQREQLLHADGRTERHAVSISFSNFANAPENVCNQDNVFVSVDITLLYCLKKLPLFTINRYVFRLTYRSRHRLYQYNSKLRNTLITSRHFQYGSEISHLTTVYIIYLLYLIIYSCSALRLWYVYYATLYCCQLRELHKTFKILVWKK